MKKIITLIVSIFMLVAILTACGNTDDTIETSETTENIETTVDESDDTTEDTEPEETTDDVEADTVSIFKDGQTEFTIVQPESPASEVSKAGAELRGAITKQGGTSISFYKEGMYKTINEGSMDGPKIVIDVLNDDETSKEIFNSFDGYYYYYTIKMCGDSLYIVGGSPEATSNAVNYFIDTYLSNKVSSLELEADMEFNSTPVPPLANLTINGNSIYDYNIVHYNGYYAELTAYDIQRTLLENIGKALPVIADSPSTENQKQDLEILIGKTTRDESQSIRNEYDRPNVYYDVAQVDNKLVIMAEGYTTLNIVNSHLEEYLNTLETDSNIKGIIASGDIIDTDNMFERADNTDVRVMSWNMAGSTDFADRSMQAEMEADTILIHLPDVFGTNELYNNYALYNFVLKEISEYYDELKSDYDFPDDPRYDPNVSGFGLRQQKIFVRKDSGIKVIDSGWRYIKYDIKSFRCFPWSVLETKDGDRFIYTVGHYYYSYNNDYAAVEQLETIAYAQEQSGSSYELPAIISGDLYTGYSVPLQGCYGKIIEAGYMDAQRTALVNANNDISHGTFHDFGKPGIGRADLDLILYNAGFEVLKFKVIVFQPALDASDHSPVVADMKF